jgi:hypothetical protein
MNAGPECGGAGSTVKSYSTPRGPEARAIIENGARYVLTPLTIALGRLARWPRDHHYDGFEPTTDRTAGGMIER